MSQQPARRASTPPSAQNAVRGGLSIAAALLGCGLNACTGEEAAPPPVEDKCPRVQMDFTGQWIRVNGSAGDHKTRFEAQAKDGGISLWYVGGQFTKRELKGERRANDWVFTQVATPAEEEAWKKGERELVRIYLEPKKDLCAMRVMAGTVKYDAANDKPKETMSPGFQEFLPFPDGQKFTFRPCDGPLFMAKAATDYGAAKKELENGGAVYTGALGDALAIGAWTDAAADGDAACTYDMDLYFDDRPAKDKDGKPRGATPAGEVKDGVRSWAVTDWYAPYSGNHHFEIYRYKTCGGGARELIAVSCTEAVLN